MCCCFFIKPSTAESKHHNNNIFTQSEKALVQLTGTYSDLSAGAITFETYRNTISFDQELFNLPLNEQGAFAMQFEINEAITAVLNCYGKKVPLFLEPSDNLKLHITASGIQFSGKGAFANQLLSAFAKRFGQYNNDYLLYEMADRSALDFRGFMDRLLEEKQTFINQYIEKHKSEKLSPAFQQYLYAELKYWYANYLLQYRIEHPIAKGLPSPMTLPANYYDFLNELVLFNDRALTSRNYIDFIENYLDFRRSNPKELVEINFSDEHLQVMLPTTLLLAEPDQMDVVEELHQGDHLRYLGEQSDFESKTLVRGVMKSFPWYRVKTACGKVGWVLGVGMNWKDKVMASESITASPSRSKIIMTAKVIFDKLLVFETATGEKIIDTLFENDQAYFLNVKTTERFRYNRKGKIYQDHFYKVETPNGKVGWIFRGGVNLEEEIITIENELPFTPQNSLSRYSDADQYLSGKTLYYIWAKDLYWKSHILNRDSLMTELQEFTSKNPYPSYNELLNKSITNEPVKDYVLISGVEILLPDPSLNATSKAKPALELSELNEIIAESNSKELVLPATDQLETSTQLISSENTEATEESLTNNTFTSTAFEPEYLELVQPKYKLNRTETLLTGKIESHNNKATSLVLYAEPILFDEKIQEIALRSNQTFRNDFSLAEATLGVIRYGNKEHKIYLEPGDQINVKMNGSKFPEALHFTGKGSAHNNFLLRLKAKFTDSEKTLKTKIRYANPEEFAQFMKSVWEKKWAFYESYKTTHEFTPGFEKFAEAEINYWYAFQMMNYPLEHPYYLEDPESFHLPKGYYDFLQDVEVYKDGALPNQNYIYFVNELLSYQKKQNENLGLTSKQLIDKYLHGETAFYAKAKNLANACKRGQAKEVGREIQEFIAECPYENFNEVLRFTYNEAKGLEPGIMAPDFVLADREGNAVQLSDYRGKVVYLDFWATWCSPCVRMMPHSQRLQDQFENQDVVFLFVSLDKNKSSWETFVKNNKLSGVHVATDNKNIYQSEIAKLYRVKHLPAYFLIDKNGKISRSPAKSPSSSLIIEQINSLLQEH